MFPAIWYIIYVPTRNHNNEFILQFILWEERWLISKAVKYNLGWNSCAEDSPNITSAKVLRDLRKMPSNSSVGVAGVFEIT